MHSGCLALVPPRLREQVIATAARANAGRVTFIVGCGRPSLEETREEIEQAAALGADAVLVTPSYYHPIGDEDVRRWVGALAETARLPALSVRVAKWLIEGDYEGWEESELDWAYYPIPPWEPQGGFTVDRALIYAVMRQESLFRRYAKSRVGARGLMQLVPSTASSMTRRYKFRGSKRYALYDPGLNMMLGQRYLAHLMKYRRIQGDLFRVATAYNGGPGNLRSWERRIQSEDDLLFIESLPLRESRMYVERVMMNLWIYRARLGQPAPTLAAVAAEREPIYEALDGREHPDANWAGERIAQNAPDESPWWQFW